MFHNNAATRAGAFLLAVSLSVSAGGPASASDDIEWRQSNQQKRISEGFKTGQLTRAEYIRLQAEQARIAEMKSNALADGVIDSGERDRIVRAQQEAGRHIYIEKHDSETRWGFWRPFARHWWQGL